MEDLKITELETAGTPANTDLLEIVQDLATTPVNKKITWSAIKAWLNYYFQSVFTKNTMLQGQGMMSAPADSSIYYVGHPGWGVSTSASYSPITFMGHSGYINRVHVRLERGGTTATSENSSVYLRVGTTDYLISDTVKLGYTQFIDLDANYLAIPIEYYSSIRLKIKTPAWVTNPTNVNVVFEVVINSYAES